MMYKHYIKILLVFRIDILFISAFECDANDDDKMVTSVIRLREDLLCNYDKHFLPLKNRSAIMDVGMGMDIVSYWISSTYPETLYLNTEIIVTWNDINLKWNPNDYENTKEMYMNSDDIWKPEILPEEMELFSNLPSILEGVECKITSIGDVTCKTESNHYGYCESDVFKWPYDIHSCVVQYMLWAQNGERIQLNITNNQTLHINEENSEWKIIDSNIEMFFVRPEKNLFVNEMYFYFDVRQDMSNTMQLFTITIFCLVVLTLMSFWTNFDEANRLVLILINILCHFYEIQNVEWHTPTAGHTIPYILAFYRDSLVLTFVQLVETMVFRKIMDSDKPLPFMILFLDRIFNRTIIKKILFIDNHYCKQIESEENESPIINDNMKYLQQTQELAKKEKLQIIDRLLFILFIIAYFIMLMIFTSL